MPLLPGRDALKRGIKRLVKRALRAPALLRRGAPSDTRILTYHSVGAHRHEMNVTPAAFEQQMRWLARHHRVIPLLEAAEGGPGIAITFDDGYRGNLLYAAPVLHALEIPATVFAVTGFAGASLPGDPDPAGGRLMTWDELRAIERLGVRAGGHTCSHVRLVSLDPSSQRAEIEGCKAALEEQLGHAVEAFAYPYGTAFDYDAHSVRLAREAGFHCALTNRYGPNPRRADRFQLRRINIDGTDSLASFQAKVEGRLDALALLEAAPALHARRALNRTLRIP